MVCACGSGFLTIQLFNNLIHTAKRSIFFEMALYYDLPVFKDVYQLILKNFDYTKDFPREYKFTLGQDLKRDGINLVRSIYRANKSKEKTPYLEIYNTTVISNLKSLNVDQLTSALQNHKKLKIKI